MNEPVIDRLVMLTASGSQFDSLVKELTRDAFHFTVMNSTSEMLQESTLCLLIGFPASRLPDLLAVVRKNCLPYKKFIPTQSLLPGEISSLPMVEAQLGGAIVYMLNVEHFEQI